MADPTLRGRITLNTQAFKTGLEKVKEAAKKAGAELKARFKRIGAAIASGIKIGLASAGVAMVAGLAITAAYAKKILDLGDNYDKMSQRTGIASDELSKFAHAADLAGTSLATVENATKDMQKALFDANNGGKRFQDTFKQIGINAEELAKLTPAEQFKTLAAAIDDVEDPSEKAAIAMILFGRSGRSLIPMFAGMKKAAKDAEDLGIVFSKQDVADAAALTDAFDRVKKSIFGLFKTAIGFKPLTVFIDNLTSKIIAFRQSAKFQQIIVQLTSLGNSALRVAAGIFNAVVNIDSSFLLLLKSGAKVGLFLTSIIGAVILAGPILKIAVMGLVQSGLLAPLAAGLALVGALVAAFNFGEILDEAFDLSGLMLVLIERIKGLFNVVGASLEAGFQTLWEHMKKPFKKGLIINIGTNMKEAASGALADAKAAEDLIGATGGIGFSAALDNKIEEIKAKLAKLADAAKEKGADLAEALGLTEAMEALEKLKRDYQKGVDDFNKKSIAAAKIKVDGADKAVNEARLVNKELDKIQARKQVKFTITGEGLESIKKKNGGNLTQAQRFTRDNNTKKNFQDAVGDVHKNRGVTSKGFNQVSRVASGSAAGVVNAVAQTANLEKLATDRNSLLGEIAAGLAKLNPVESFGDV